MLEQAALPHNSRLLEIGPGLGQLTIPLISLQSNLSIVAVEPGAELARTLNEKLTAFFATYAQGLPSDFGSVEVRNQSFESFARSVSEKAKFDAIVAGSSLHWVKGEEKYAQLADVLVENGSLIALWIQCHEVKGPADKLCHDIFEH